MDADTETFSPETLQSIFKLVWKDSNTKASKDALTLCCEFFRLFVSEAVQRAAEQTEVNDSVQENRIEVEHLERILNQLMLDF
ncbi:centromere protein X-like protein [Radiomyces spectabilis]|uniref:centromere protein X-like protein n=1 Tax=Radiomyces spectabilis TaxID=64574 RepID=UPI00221EC37E|nr:centromere protein X-like protein [Radiomyces spectabilis]KAI8376419.1 centromere protein X-like protein [Radiomyces spectabilis]